MAAAVPRPYRFDERIDAARPVLGRPAEMAARIIALEADLARLRAEQDAAVAAAAAAARAEANTSAEQATTRATLHAVDALHAAIEDLTTARDEALATLASDALSLACAAAEVLAGAPPTEAATAAIERAVARALERLARGTEIRANVHPAQVAAIEAFVADWQARDRRRIALAVVPDASLAPGDARLTWDDGGVEVSAERRRAIVAAEVAALRGALGVTDTG